MKRKFGDRANWKRVLDKEYAQAYLKTEEFQGYVTLLKIKKVTEPLYVSYSKKPICIADDDYVWLQHFPTDQHYCVTTMFDEKGKVVKWYIDICYRNGISKDNIPWMDDLFLDIVVLPSGEVIEKDADELAEALRNGSIDNNQFELAKKESAKLVAAIADGQFNLLNQSEDHRSLLLAQLPRQRMENNKK